MLEHQLPISSALADSLLSTLDTEENVESVESQQDEAQEMEEGEICEETQVTEHVQEGAAGGERSQVTESVQEHNTSVQVMQSIINGVITSNGITLTPDPFIQQDGVISKTTTPDDLDENERSIIELVRVKKQPPPLINISSGSDDMSNHFSQRYATSTPVPVVINCSVPSEFIARTRAQEQRRREARMRAELSSSSEEEEDDSSLADKQQILQQFATEFITSLFAKIRRDGKRDNKRRRRHRGLDNEMWNKSPPRPGGTRGTPQPPNVLAPYTAAASPIQDTYSPMGSSVFDSLSTSIHEISLTEAYELTHTSARFSGTDDEVNYFTHVYFFVLCVES